MPDLSNSGISTTSEAEIACEVNAVNTPITSPEMVPPQLSKWYILRRSGAELARYLLDSEVHTFAFSVAANSILSFIPFVALLYTLSLTVFHSPYMATVVGDLVGDYFPSTASAGFWAQLRLVVPRHLQIVSVILVLISCTGLYLSLGSAL